MIQLEKMSTMEIEIDWWLLESGQEKEVHSG